DLFFDLSHGLLVEPGASADDERDGVGLHAGHLVNGLTQSSDLELVVDLLQRRQRGLEGERLVAELELDLTIAEAAHYAASCISTAESMAMVTLRRMTLSAAPTVMRAPMICARKKKAMPSLSSTLQL